MRRTRTKTIKPLLKIRKPLKSVAYRAKLKPYDSLRYLDVRSLLRATRARVELGVIATPAGSATVIADIRAGQVTGLRLKDCPGCPTKRRKLPKEQLKNVMAQMRVSGGVKLPMPVARMIGRRGLRIPIGPIIIVIGEPDMTFCIEWTRPDGTICWWCLFDASGCMKMGPPM